MVEKRIGLRDSVFNFRY